MATRHAQALAAARADRRLSPFDLNGMDERVKHGVKATKSAGFEMNLAPGSHGAKNAAKVMAAFEGAGMLDLIGQRLGCPGLRRARRRRARQRALAPTCSSSTPEHIEAVWEKCGAPDAWGEGISPSRSWPRPAACASSMALGPSSSRAACSTRRMRWPAWSPCPLAFPGVPLRLDPNANWTLETSIKARPALNDLLELLRTRRPPSTA